MLDLPPERAKLPELPRLRALENQAVEMPVSVSSAASSTSPKSRSSRVHPYNPVGEAAEGSSFEVVPTIATRAASASGQYEPKPGCRNGLRFDQAPREALELDDSYQTLILWLDHILLETEARLSLVI